MNDFEKELSEAVEELDYLLKDLSTLPALIQLKVVQEVLLMAERLKPVYVMMLKIDKDIEEGK